MEAKVDIKKLQLLNDRIAQVMDALSQVRLSVHGLTHTGAPIGQSFAGLPPVIAQSQLGFPPQIGFQPQFTGVQSQYPYGPQLGGFPQTPYLSAVPGALPFGQFGMQGALQSPFGVGAGLQHTGYSPLLQGASPLSGWGGVSPWPSLFGGGLYHSPELIEQRLVEQKANDPNRIVQTFPYCLAPISALSTW